MSYQVLARKWRPRTFREMVGQEHVLKALINALDHGRLHHAYLFTGTRGVGKTTIARILAKSLNCEAGISSDPCGQCSSCVEIDEGRFVDLIEVDAASRTKVEDTREILDNVQYAPTRGRYKVYLIDEVHMLSGHSFNALLKTLEEPPEHVKFLLATTDPQKLPVTILSRCLQFSLKAMSPERVVGHLKNVLEKEMVPFEETALWALGRAADGSMRDALSLTDQAISFGGGKVSDVDVRAMLGSIDREYVYHLLDCLREKDGARLLETIARMSEQSPDYAGVLADLISALHRLAMAQVAPDAVDDSDGARAQVLDMAQAFTAEEVQLYYQTALLGRKDLPLAPDARSGFEMILLRMLLFRPAGVVGVAAQPPAQTGASAGGPPAKKSIDAAAGGTQPGAGGSLASAPEPQTSRPEAARPGNPQARGALDQIRNQLSGDSRPSASHARRAPPQDNLATQREPETPPKSGRPDLKVVEPAGSMAMVAPQPSPAPRGERAAGENNETWGPGPEQQAEKNPAKEQDEKQSPESANDAAKPQSEKFGDAWADLLMELPLNSSALNFARN
ncbi:MAG: DNA polymerase III subunit gamma/tau, partial [Ketobacteraceae bacterium]|nr:DNA polymerase III subunit gamma/tau [Ketobacteraceae bacterium]